MAEGTQLPPALLKYWTVGEGAALIRWDTPGDYDRCVIEVEKKVTENGHAPLPDGVIHGMCNTLHEIVTGAAPGHAPGDKA